MVSLGIYVRSTSDWLGFDSSVLIATLRWCLVIIKRALAILHTQTVAAVSWLAYSGYGDSPCERRFNQSEYLSFRLNFYWLKMVRISKTCIVLVEDLRAGYPRYSALIGANKCFHICRRFSKLRARLLLLKQDKLCLLERQLEELDATENTPIYLGCSRQDANEQRAEVIAKIDAALQDYGM